MSKENRVKLFSSKTLTEQEAALKKMKEQVPIMVEYYRVVAKLHREKFKALKEQGFTDAEALELCKDVV